MERSLDQTRIFGELRYVSEDPARSVTSPAAYFVELLGLLEGTFDKPALLERRPDLKKIVLDEDNTFTETAYLDIVNEVLERLVVAGKPAGTDPYKTLRGESHPFALPFTLHSARLRAALQHLDVTPEELYRLFAAHLDHDVAAREHLGMTQDEWKVVTVEATTAAALGTRYGLEQGETIALLADTRRFEEATGLDDAQLRELVELPGQVVAGPAGLNADETQVQGPGGKLPVPFAWFERANRLIRLARRAGLSLTDADLILTSFRGGLLDAEAVRAVAATVRLTRLHGVTVADVCALVIPWTPDEDVEVEFAAGDILTPANRDYRFRLAALIGVAEPDVVQIVTRYRERYSAREPSPFDRGVIQMPEITLIRRAGLLAGALGVGAGELFDLLVALEGDPALQRYSTFTVIGAPAAETRDLHKVLQGPAPAAMLWLAQTLFAVAAWMRGAGFDGAELSGILGGRPETATQDDLFQHLADSLSETALTLEVLRSDRFSERAAQVIHDVLVAYDKGVVAEVGSSLLDLDPEALDPVRAAAYQAVTDLGVVYASDFEGLGLGERFAGKIFRNLVFRGYLNADGALAVAGADELELSGDFDDLRETLFKSIGATINGAAAYYPSDLAAYDALSEELRDELYDNLIFNGYLEENGDLADPDFFLNPDALEDFHPTVDLSDFTGPVAELIEERLDSFREDPLALDTSALAPLRLTDAQLGRLIESLVFNGYLDVEGDFTDVEALSGLTAEEFALAGEFVRLRPEILDLLQNQVAARRAELTTFSAEDFTALADELAAERAFALLDGDVLRDGRVVDEALFAGEDDGTLDLASEMGPDFGDADTAQIHTRIARILADQAPYRVSPGTLIDLGFADEEAGALLAHLEEAGDLTSGQCPAADRLGYFANADNSLDYRLPGMEDYARDVFFLLNAAATELTAAVDELLTTLTDLAAAQNVALGAGLADALGLSADAASALCQAVAGGAREARLLLARPALDGDDLPDDPRLPLALRRIRRFALLSAKLGLDPTEISAVFLDQDLTGKYPEPLTLPAGVEEIEALLDSADGTIYLFAEGGYWTFSGITYAQTSTDRKPLSELSPNLSAIVSVDAAFARPDGTEWLIGHDAGGNLTTFVRQPGGTRWAPRAQTWGKIKNGFADPARIDSAFTDPDGRTFLFAGDQYVRYSAGLDTADEGFPRPIAEWWEREGLDLAPGERVDASFTDSDGTVHLFTGTHWSIPEDDAPAADVWGVVRPTFDGLKSVDAAYSAPSAVHGLFGNEQLTYSDSVENAGVRADEGAARRLTGVPPQFENGVEAAFTDPTGVVHLFRDGRTVALTGTNEIVATADRWGRMAPVLADGRVNAAFSGLDGKTYLFSGTTYLRYSTGDYTTADSGYPRSVDTDWGCLTAVAEAFVMDGRTYLFGSGGLLFDVPPAFQPDLAAGTVTPELRNLLQQHGLTLTGVTGVAPQWRLATAEGVTVTVKLEGLRLKAFGDGSRFYVRYSTRDYKTPDAGFPKPLSDNWWNMPDGLGLGPIDAVFTGSDERTYLFAGDRFVRFDARHRWWSEPQRIADHWASLPFDSPGNRVDAGFVGVDGRTYLFSGDRYVRYSSADYTEVDDGYPSLIANLWGKVSNTIARTGKVDAGLVVETIEKIDGVDVPRTYTYLFSGDQYVRYSGGLDLIDPGYPSLVSRLNTEPGLTALPATLDGVDAAFSDRRTSYLIRGGLIHAVSASQYRRYTDLPQVGCAFVEDGSILAEPAPRNDEGPDWVHLSALEGRAVTATEFRPRSLREAPERYRTGLDAVLKGADGNTYLFQREMCFNVGLNADYPIAEEWGRPRNSFYETGAVEAAFVGLDGRTYLFSDDQYISYDATGVIEGDPQPIAGRWAGLTSVVLAYVHEENTFLFERPGDDGSTRLAVYTGPTYTAPDDGYPTTTGIDHFSAEFPFPQAVIVEDDTLILVAGEECVSRDEKTGHWSRIRPAERLFPGLGEGIDHPDGLRSAFKAADGFTYFFFDETFAVFQNDAFGPLTRVRDRWGVSRTPFPAPGGTIDAAFVWRGSTYLFSGDRYVRYSGGAYEHIDAGYPKTIAVELRKEPPFTKLPDTFEDDLFSGGVPRRLDAVVGNERTIHLLVGGVCHTVSPDPAASFSLRTLGAIRNTLADTGKVDAALVADRRIYLFSGDQYVRYSTADRTYVDDGYPKPLEALISELANLPWLPEEFANGLDAVFRDQSGGYHLFKGRSYLHGVEVRPVSGRWGLVRNVFDEVTDYYHPGVRAAFTTPTGELYVFRGDQYVRYAADNATLEYADPGYPRTVRDDWGDLPSTFEAGPDGAFVLDGRTYLLKDGDYVRYSGGYHAVDRTFPQPFARRWSGTADYRLTDVHTIVRFAELCRAHPDGLAAFFVDGAEDPYAFLATAFGWELDEIRWARRNMALLHPETSEERLFEIEFLLTLTDLFATTARLGAGPSEVHSTVWAKAYDPAPGPDGPDLNSAATALLGMLQRRSPQWDALEKRINAELNVQRRDALVAYLVPPHGTSRDLYEKYLVDVDMGVEGTTSRVREAIAATQLYLQRYLLGLEQVTPPAGSGAPEEVKERLRTWWTWMRNYRTWEANRKVFLFPENYLRPELRTRKTPAFQALEDDLLQGEITSETVQVAYKRYLDEYTEVSRLAIAGGYVYQADEDADNVRRLVIFGRTRTEPRRYYFREASFRDDDHLTAAWEPWQKVDAQITADRVDPVHAFGRVFVFWPVIEAVPQSDPSKTTITTTGTSGNQTVSAPPPKFQVKIYYSFRNLNGEWVSAQLLAADTEKIGQITDVSLYVQASRQVPGVSDHDSIVVQCSYNVVIATITTPVTTAFTLTPELYPLPATQGTIAPPKPADLSKLILEPSTTPIKASEVIRFNMPAESLDGPWVAVDHKGGSFLCRPRSAPAAVPGYKERAGNLDRLPTTTPAWGRVDAGFKLTDGTLYFFDAAAGQYVSATAAQNTYQQTKKPVGKLFGLIATNLARTGVVDAAFVRDNSVVYTFSGDEYYKYSSFPTLDTGYPKKIANNTDNLPKWQQVDAAFTLGRFEVFYSRSQQAYVTNDALTTLKPANGWGGKTGPDKIFIREGRDVFVIVGGQYFRLSPDVTPDKQGRDVLPKNGDGVTADPAGPSIRIGPNTISFDNTAQKYTQRGPGADETPKPQTDLGRIATDFNTNGAVTAAYFTTDDKKVTRLYLVGKTQFVRYTMNTDGTIPAFIDSGYPKSLALISPLVPLPTPVLGVFVRNGLLYVFTAQGYAILPDGKELDTALTYTPYQGNWRGLPANFPAGFEGMLDSDTGTYLFFGGRYYPYPASDTVRRPFEIASLPNDIIRLTSSTAYELNRRLLVGGVDALLDPTTQELDELPAFSPSGSDATTIQYRDGGASSVPVSSRLEFDSSNGVYYWEIFCHAPLLIAQALNNAQRFEDARTWYEYVFDPTRLNGFWQFLPFLAVDVAALVAGAREDMTALNNTTLTSRLGPVLTAIEAMTPAFRGARALTADERGILEGYAGDVLNPVRTQLASMAKDKPKNPATISRLGERVELIAQLERQYNLFGNREALLEAYLDDPFDPHAIAVLRPDAYRRAVVMGYIDNLLDWGDLLFRQYTAESVDEARMLYIYAYDLLGARPRTLDADALPPVAPYELTGTDTGAGETDHLTADGAMLEKAGAVHGGVANPYFYVPGNEVLLEYWTRVEDRLTKIRASLDIMGISRPLPLFDPPLDVMALVRGAAAGISADQIAAAAAAPLSPYRFDAVIQRAKDLVGRLQQLGSQLLDVIDRRDSEALGLLRNQQDAEILALTRQIKEAQVTIAEQNLAEAQASRDAAQWRVTYYEKLIAEGMSPTQRSQLAMMGTAAGLSYASSILKVGAAIAQGAPQAHLGPFIMGTSIGGDEIGGALTTASDVLQTASEGFSLTGELLGVQADFERTSQDWELQLQTGRSDLQQIGHQVASAELQLAVARRDLEIHLRQMAQTDAVTDFLARKFANTDLFGWMTGQVAGLYFQTYQMAYDMARAAERSFEAERGSAPGILRPTYWDSLRKGLLAGDQLGLDLDRLSQAYAESDTRGLEITKQVSLLALDPLALLNLKNGGRCEFAFTETLFDRDFPGHYLRQIKAVSVAFTTADGPVTCNATLTRVDGKTVLTPDPKAVKFLLDPKGAPPESLRADFRTGQKVALSEVPEGAEDSGVFDPRFDDPRYLPFEGTGAVSRWRLETRRAPADLRDVVITVRYTAEDGGETFATAVRGMLRPYPTAAAIDVAAVFEDDWSAFQEEGGELRLSMTADLLPQISGRQVTGVAAIYGTGGGPLRFLLNGDPKLALTPGQIVTPPGLTIGAADWLITAEGEPSDATGLTLLVLYRAQP